MLHREPGANQVVELELSYEAGVELGVFELLTKRYQQFSHPPRVLVAHCQVTISLEAPDIALQ